jgi:hypothetical protein
VLLLSVLVMNVFVLSVWRHKFEMKIGASEVFFMPLDVGTLVTQLVRK